MMIFAAAERHTHGPLPRRTRCARRTFGLMAFTAIGRLTQAVADYPMPDLHGAQCRLPDNRKIFDAVTDRETDALAVRQAQSICHACLVRQECRTWIESMPAALRPKLTVIGGLYIDGAGRLRRSRLHGRQRDTQPPATRGTLGQHRRGLKTAHRAAQAAIRTEGGSTVGQDRDESTPRPARHDPGRSPSSGLHGDARWRKLRHDYRMLCKAHNAKCSHCCGEIDYDAKPGSPNSFEADHIKSVAERPDLALTRTNLQPAHAACNRSAGGKLGRAQQLSGNPDYMPRETQARTIRMDKASMVGCWIPADWPNPNRCVAHEHCPTNDYLDSIQTTA